MATSALWRSNGSQSFTASKSQTLATPSWRTTNSSSRQPLGPVSTMTSWTRSTSSPDLWTTAKMLSTKYRPSAHTSWQVSESESASATMLATLSPPSLGESPATDLPVAGAESATATVVAVAQLDDLEQFKDRLANTVTGVGVALGILLVAVAGYFLLRRQKKQRQRERRVPDEIPLERKETPQTAEQGNDNHNDDDGNNDNNNDMNVRSLTNSSAMGGAGVLAGGHPPPMPAGQQAASSYYMDGSHAGPPTSIGGTNLTRLFNSNLARFSNLQDNGTNGHNPSPSPAPRMHRLNGAQHSNVHLHEGENHATYNFSYPRTPTPAAATHQYHVPPTTPQSRRGRDIEHMGRIIRRGFAESDVTLSPELEQNGFQSIGVTPTRNGGGRGRDLNMVNEHHEAQINGGAHDRELLHPQAHRPIIIPPPLRPSGSRGRREGETPLGSNMYAAPSPTPPVPDKNPERDRR